MINSLNIVIDFVKSRLFSASGHELAKKNFSNKCKKKIRVGTVYSAAIKSTETSWIGVVHNVQIL